MKKMMTYVLAKIHSPLFMQRILEFNVSVSHALMGIGSTGTLNSLADSETLRSYQKKVSPGSKLIFFDVGANIGQYAHLIIHEMNQHSFSIHSFEPSKETFKDLRSALGGDGRCVLNNVGLGQKEETLKLYADSPGSGCASLTKPLYERVFNYEQEVKIITLDDYCLKNKIEKIDWLKIDVEGHELDVLRGAIRMFKEKKITHVYFEFGFPALETRVFIRDFFEFFKEHGLMLHRVTLAGTLVPLKRYRGSYEQFRASSAYFASLR